MTYITREYQVRFTTPAFLGNAEQSGEWRTPPFKALLRQWWRVAVAAGYQYNVGAIRRQEGTLFGVAADGEDSRQSQIRIRLNRWDAGKLGSWSGLDAQRVTHPEVKNRQGVSAPVGAHLYLGYGPLEYRQGGTALKKSAAIQAEETAKLKLAFPAEHAPALDTALWLMDRYGAIGGRSRNGWGSFSMTPITGMPAPTRRLDGYSRHWQEALTLDWPHAIGTTGGEALIWQTDNHGDWKTVMKRLAEIKIGLRTQFSFAEHANGGDLRDRHLLSYPVTKHATKAFDRNARIPNSLRFKVRPADDGKLTGIIVHLPCGLPAGVWSRGERLANGQLESVWQRVYHFLDQSISRTSA